MCYKLSTHYNVPVDDVTAFGSNGCKKNLNSHNLRLSYLPEIYKYITCSGGNLT